MTLVPVTKLNRSTWCLNLSKTKTFGSLLVPEKKQCSLNRILCRKKVQTSCFVEYHVSCPQQRRCTTCLNEVFTYNRKDAKNKKEENEQAHKSFQIHQIRYWRSVNYIFLHRRWKQFQRFGPLAEKLSKEKHVKRRRKQSSMRLAYSAHWNGSFFQIYDKTNEQMKETENDQQLLSRALTRLEVRTDSKKHHPQELSHSVSAKFQQAHLHFN